MRVVRRLRGESQAPRPSWAPDTDRPSGLLEPLGRWDDHGAPIRCVSFCRGDTWLLSADALGQIRVSDVASRETLYTLSGGDRVSGPIRGLATSAAPWAHPRGPSTTVLQRPLGTYGAPGQGGGDTCWVLAASPTEVLLWKADSGEVYARQPILPEAEEGEAGEEGEERDVIVGMDCVLVLPPCAPSPMGPSGAENFAPPRPASETPPSSAASLASSSSPPSLSDTRVHVCVCTRQGQAVVWAVSITDPAVSSCQRLHGPSSNGQPMQLQGIAFQNASADRVLAWGPADVALWERFAVSAEAVLETGKARDGEREWGEEEEGEEEDASVFVSREEGGQDETAAGSVVTGLSAGSEYRLVYASQVGEAEFMHGCCLAGRAPGSGGLRLVLREGWVLEQALGGEGR